MTDRMMELDFALREALKNGDSDAVLRLTDSYLKLVNSVMDREGDEMRERLARQLSDLLSRNIELAIKVRENLRSELRTVLKQRQLAGGGGGGANEPAASARCSFCV